MRASSSPALNGFRDIVVRPTIECRDLCVIEVPRRDHDDGNLRLLADSTRHFDSVDVRQSEVEQNDVDHPGLHQLHCALPGRRLDRLVSMMAQGRAQKSAHVASSSTMRTFRAGSLMVGFAHGGVLGVSPGEW